MKPTWLVLSGVLIVLLGVLFLWIGLVMWKRIKRVQDFASTKGVVLEAAVEEHVSVETEDGEEVRSVSYSPKIRYEYEVQGQRYEGDRYDILRLRTSDRARVQEIVAQYPVGQECTVHYNPQNPQESVLSKETGGTFAWVFIGMGGLIVLIGVVELVWVMWKSLGG
jgi:hypothetical protein